MKIRTYENEMNAMEDGTLWNINDENIALFKADEVHYRCCLMPLEGNRFEVQTRPHDI